MPPGLFSGTERLTEEPANDGARLPTVLVLPVPGADQPLSPSALEARTRTWYWVPVVRPLMLDVVTPRFCGPSIQPPEVPSRYCTS